MAYDRKYGKVTLEFGSIGEDEPVVVMRAQDALLPKVLNYYHELCREHGSPQRHLDIISNTKNTVLEWQNANYTRMPNSENSRGRLVN